MLNASLPIVEARSIAPAPAVRGYVPGLDGLRAIAVLLVILYHSDPDGPFGGGFIGVDLFFVLSAFLITSILVDQKEKTGSIRLGQFYWRRALRLTPALLFFLATYVVVAPMIWPGYPHLRDALIAGFYVSNFAYVAEQIPVYIVHTWSLAAEEQFYLLWPVMLLLLLRWKRPALLLGVIWTGLTAFRFTTDDWFAYYYDLARHGTGLVLGAILFFLLREGKLALSPIHAIFAAAIVAILSVNAQLGASAMAITVAEFASAIVIGTVITNPASLRLLTARPLVGIGKLSYGLYLWNYPISRALGEHVCRQHGRHWLIRFAEPIWTGAGSILMTAFDPCGHWRELRVPSTGANM